MSDSCNCCPGNRQTGDGASPYYFQNFLTRPVAFASNGAAINALYGGAGAVFPRLARVATLDLQSNAGIIGLSLSSTISNFVAGSNCAIVLGLDNGETCDINGMSQQFMNHICGQNSIAGLPASSSRTNALQMGQNSFYSVNSGQQLALYASSPNDAQNLLAGIMTVFWFAR